MIWPCDGPLEARNSSPWTIEFSEGAEHDIGRLGHCWVCALPGTQWPPLSWLLCWHLRRMSRD